jgi:hypothetical protein
MVMFADGMLSLSSFSSLVARVLNAPQLLLRITNDTHWQRAWTQALKLRDAI